MIPTMPRSFNPNSEAGRRLEVVGQASCLSSAGVAVAGDFFPESFTSADRLACGSEQPTARREACPTTRTVSASEFGLRPPPVSDRKCWRCWQRNSARQKVLDESKCHGGHRPPRRLFSSQAWWPAGLANDLAWLARLIWMSEGIETLIHT